MYVNYRNIPGVGIATLYHVGAEYVVTVYSDEKGTGYSRSFATRSAAVWYRENIRGK